MPTAVEQARKIHADASATYRAIDADTRLSLDGKTEAKIRHWADTSRKLTALREQEQKLQDNRRQSLHRSLFGLPAGATSSDVIAYRDAVDRASRLDNEQAAARLLTSAHAAGDNIMVRAIVEQAVENLWGGILNTYTDEMRPETTAGIQELLDPPPSATMGMTSDLEFVAPSPDGLSSMTSAALESRARAIEAADNAPAAITGSGLWA